MPTSPRMQTSASGPPIVKGPGRVGSSTSSPVSWFKSATMRFGSLSDIGASSHAGAAFATSVRVNLRFAFVGEHPLRLAAFAHQSSRTPTTPATSAAATITTATSAATNVPRGPCPSSDNRRPTRRENPSRCFILQVLQDHPGRSRISPRERQAERRRRRRSSRDGDPRAQAPRPAPARPPPARRRAQPSRRGRPPLPRAREPGTSSPARRRVALGRGSSCYRATRSPTASTRRAARARGERAPAPPHSARMRSIDGSAIASPMRHTSRCSSRSSRGGSTSATSNASASRNVMHQASHAPPIWIVRPRAHRTTAREVESTTSEFDLAPNQLDQAETGR